MVEENNSNLELISSVKISKTCIYFNECSKSEVHDGKSWKYHWYRYQDGWICKQHYKKLIYPTKPKKIYCDFIRKCSIPECNKTEIYNGKRWKEKWTWYQQNTKWICYNHYKKLVFFPKVGSQYQYRKKYNDKYNLIHNPIYQSRRLIFKDKRVSLKENPRKGQCELCGNRIGDEFVNYKRKIVKTKQTHIHHIKYNYDDYLKDTIEVCVSCHGKETWKNKKK